MNTNSSHDIGLRGAIVAKFCGGCGTGLLDTARFCGECGEPVASSPPPDVQAGADVVSGVVPPQTPMTFRPPVSTSPPARPPAADDPSAEPLAVGQAPAPGAQSPSEPGLGMPPGAPAGSVGPPPAGVLARLTPEALLAGDWLSGTRIAGVAVAMMMVTIVVGALFAQAWDKGTKGFVVSVLALTGSAVGGDLVYSYNGPAAHTGFMPLTATLVGLGALVFLLLRWQDRHSGLSMADRIVQACRAVVMFSALSLVVALVGRGTFSSGSSDPFDVSLHVTVAGTFFGALLLSLFAVVLTLAMRPAELPPRVRRVRDAVAGPVHALALSGAVALALTALGGAVLIGVSLDSQKAAAIGGLLVALPNAMVYAVLTGMGVSSSVDGASVTLDPLNYLPGSLGQGGDGSVGLLDLTSSSAWFWLLTVGSVVVWVIAALLTVVGERDQVVARRAGVWLVGCAVCVSVVGAWLAGTSFSSDSSSSSGSLGPSAGGAFLLTLLWAGVAVFLAVGLAPQLRPALGPVMTRVLAYTSSRRAVGGEGFATPPRAAGPEHPFPGKSL